MIQRIKQWWRLRKYRKSVRGIERVTAARRALNGPNHSNSKTTEAVSRPGSNPGSRSAEEGDDA